MPYPTSHLFFILLYGFSHSLHLGLTHYILSLLFSLHLPAGELMTSEDVSSLKTAFTVWRPQLVCNRYRHTLCRAEDGLHSVGLGMISNHAQVAGHGSL